MSARGGINGTRELVEGFVRDYFNGRDLSASARYLADNYVQHSPTVSGGRGGLDKMFAAMFEAVPDLKVEILQLVCEGDRASAILRWVGTVTGRLPGIDAYVEGKPIDFRTAEFWRVENGKFAEHWDVYDIYTVLSQLGLLGSN